MHGEPAHHLVAAGDGSRNLVAPVCLAQLTALHQIVQAFFEVTPFGSVRTQFAHELLEAGVLSWLLLDFAEDRAVGDQRAFTVMIIEG